MSNEASPLLASPKQYGFSAQRGLVAQISNLPYRRFVIGRAFESSSALALADLPQNAILRYSRLQICATLKTYQAVDLAEGSCKDDESKCGNEDD